MYHNPFMMLGGPPGPGMPPGPMGFPPGMAEFMAAQGMAMMGGPPPPPQMTGPGPRLDGPPPAGPAGPGPGSAPNRSREEGPKGGRMCMRFMQTGNCNYGDSCKFSHGKPEGRELKLQGPPAPQHYGAPPADRGGDQGGWGGGRPPGGGSGGPSSSSSSSNNNSSSNSGSMRKTRLCDKFMTTGFCPYGDKCTFAHGADQLRAAPSREGDAGGGAGQGQAMPPPRPAPPQEPYPGGGNAPKPGAPPPQAAMADTPAPLGPGAAASAAKAPGPSHGQGGEVTFVDKVRAICGVLAIGNAAALGRDKPLALQTAAMSLRNGNALRDNPFADSVEHYLVQDA